MLFIYQQATKPAPENSSTGKRAKTRVLFKHETFSKAHVLIHPVLAKASFLN
jgi:hypothetical protein